MIAGPEQNGYINKIMETGTIQGTTRVCGIIGDPIAHTMSPAMHNAAFKALGLDYVYTAFRVQPDALESAIKGIRALGIRGLNITIPHKIRALSLIDEPDTLARQIRAINTIVNDGGILRGYNTDAGGFLRAMSESGCAPQGKNVVLLGAGGAARAIAFALADSGAHIKILNRETGFDRARKLAETVQGFYKEVTVSVGILSEKTLENTVKDADILVNATSVGMSPSDACLVPEYLLRPALAVFDIVYAPHITSLIADAKAVGAKAVDGLEMLVWQGALSFTLWTGCEAPVTVMKQAAKEELKRR